MDEVVVLHGEKKLEFTNAEKEAYLRLIGIEINPMVAEIMIFLTRSPEASLYAIQRGTNLPLPKISISLHHMIEQGWVESRTDIGGGHKSKIFRLTKPLPEIIESIEIGMPPEDTSQDGPEWL
jgi:predicted transcriptional regulator